MSAASPLHCPWTGEVLRTEDGVLAATTGGARYALRGGVPDLRAPGVAEIEPEPLLRGELARPIAALESGSGFREVLEQLLLDLPLERAQRLMLVLREGRAAWLPLLQGVGGSALFIGNALSGSVTAFALAGFEPTLLDLSLERLRFARERCKRASGRRPELVVGGDGPRLPFPDRAFELVVQELGPGARAFGHPLAELTRVGRGEVALTADNRLGYKRSAGRHGVFRVPGPLEFAATALRPPPEMKTLRGHRRALAATGCEKPRAFALYPHSQDFTHVVALDARVPVLRVGPKERRNFLKIAGLRLGLFPLLAPSFAFLCSRRGRKTGAPRIERVLSALAERLGEPAMETEQLVATRGHTALFLTRARNEPETARAGRLCIHVPLSPQRRVLAERHFRALELVRARHPGFPVPAPRFLGEVEGLWLTCEERLEGLTAPQLSGRTECTHRMLSDAARDLARLVHPLREPLDEEGFELLLGRKFELAARHAAVPSTLSRLEELREVTRARLLGRAFPRALCHGDLRGKHVQVRSEGSVVGYLDWGTWEEEGLPYYDLLHLLVHERRQEAELAPGRAWRLVLAPDGLRAGERAALDEYARMVRIDADVRAAIEAAYPVLVAAMAESTWDYSRPRWLHLSFGL